RSTGRCRPATRCWPALTSRMGTGPPMPRSRPGGRTRRSAPGSPRPSRKPWPTTCPRSMSASSTRRTPPRTSCSAPRPSSRRPGPTAPGLAASAPPTGGPGGGLRGAMLLMALAYAPASQRPHWSLRLGFASQYFPGTGSVDVIAADGYNRGGCRSHIGPRPTQPAVTPGSLFDPVLTFARTHGGLPVFIAEWGSAFYSGVPAWQGEFLPKMQAYVPANPSIAAVLYWNQGGFYGCQFAITGHPLSLTAMAAMGRVINGHLG